MATTLPAPFFEPEATKDVRVQITQGHPRPFTAGKMRSEVAASMHDALREVAEHYYATIRTRCNRISVPVTKKAEGLAMRLFAGHIPF